MEAAGGGKEVRGLLARVTPFDLHRQQPLERVHGFAFESTAAGPEEGAEVDDTGEKGAYSPRRIQTEVGSESGDLQGCAHRGSGDRRVDPYALCDFQSGGDGEVIDTIR